LRIAEGVLLPLPGLRVPDAWHGRELAVGIRPEHLLRADAASGPGAADGAERDGRAFEAAVDVVEPVGSEAFVNLRLPGQVLVARLPPGRLPRVDEAVRMRVAGEHVYCFDPVDGKRLEP